MQPAITLQRAMHHAWKLKPYYFLEVTVKGTYLNFTYYGFQEVFKPTVTTVLAKLFIFIVSFV